MDQFKNIISFIEKKLDYESTVEERERWFEYLNSNENIVTEKVVSKVNNNGYNFGNFLLSKESTSQASASYWTKEFIENYVDKIDREIFDYCQQVTKNLNKINLYLTIVYEIKINKLKKNDVEHINDFLLN